MIKLLTNITAILLAITTTPSFSTKSQPNSLENQLAEIASVLSDSTKIIKAAWSEPLDALESMTAVCEAEGGITNDTTKVGGLNTVTSVVCDENGVIVITTKNGYYNQENTVSFETYVGTTNATNLPTLLNAQQHGEMIWQSKINDGVEDTLSITSWHLCSLPYRLVYSRHNSSPCFTSHL